MARVVRFIHKCSPYNCGERAGFPEALAARYVDRGIAEYVTTDVPGALVTKDAGAHNAREPDAGEARDVMVPQAEPEAAAPEEDKPRRLFGSKKKKKKAARTPTE
jgi:hypothetical protein